MTAEQRGISDVIRYAAPYFTKLFDKLLKYASDCDILIMLYWALFWFDRKETTMGKNLKGKEIGEGLSQRRDGRFSARFVTASGKRIECYFNTLPEARNWLDDAKHSDRHNQFCFDYNMTVDEWFKFWMENIVCDLAPNTRRNYSERYKKNIQPVIGKMRITDVKPLHCKMVLNRMEQSYAGSSIRQTYIAMGTLFRSAILNQILLKHPMDGVQFTKPIKATNDIRFLTKDEQRRFLEVAKGTHNYDQYALILETGLRTGELIGLTFNAIDFEKRTLTVNKTLEYRHDTKMWRAGPPKSASSYRTIPLTNRAYDILKKRYDERLFRKEDEELSTVLDYMDRKDGKKKQFSMRDLVFINFRTGKPEKNSSYDTHLYKLCKEAGLRQFSMHTLRHTYATRAIESGMPPKVLQGLLGHSSIKTTMDRYVHNTEDAMLEAVKQFEAKNVDICA